MPSKILNINATPPEAPRHLHPSVHLKPQKFSEHTHTSRSHMGNTFTIRAKSLLKTGVDLAISTPIVGDRIYDALLRRNLFVFRPLYRRS